MPELEPITRKEMLWSGEDIEPITREEMYIKHIFDKTQTIPSKPLTRKEMLLEKAGEGGGSDVTIKQLSVTANGTYSEEGTAYSPVIVNVPAPPIPDNAYLLNEVEGLPSDIASFTDGSNLPMPSLKVSILLIQEGSGDPSPTNKRPISGHTEANVVVSPTTDAEDGTTHNIQFKDGDNPLTVYGGTLDVVSGKLTVDRFYFEISNFDAWIYQDYNNYKALYKTLSDLGYPPIKQSEDKKVISDKFEYKLGGPSLPFGVVSIYQNGIIYFWNNDDVYANKNEMIAAMNSIKPAIVYELATPQSIQLTPTQVKSLLGSNNVWCDTGKIEELEYFSKEV